MTLFERHIQEINDDYAEHLYHKIGCWEFSIYGIEDDYRCAYLDEILDIFFKEYILFHTDTVDLLWEIRDLIQDAELFILDEWKLLDKYENALNNFFANFKYPEIDLTNNRDILIQEVLNLDENNGYNRTLRRALLYCFWNKTDELTTTRIIDEILVDYDFGYKIPQEQKYYAAERYRIKNHIPDFSNVTVGQTWTGTRRMANFIKALKLKPMPAGKNVRAAQENSIRRSCEWTDDEETKVLTLTKIFPTRLDKIVKKRTRKYQNLFEIVLLYHLQKEDKPLTTTMVQFFKDIDVISSNYRDYPLYLYHEEDALKGIVSSKELGVCHRLFKELAHERLGRILKTNLDYLSNEGTLNTSSYIVIVVPDINGKRHIPIHEVDELGISSVEAREMIENATKHVLSQISFYDKTSGQHITLKSMDEIRIHHKSDEFKELYEEYIKENYGWSYTYEAISVSIPYGCEVQKVTFEDYDSARKKLNEMLVDALKTTLGKRNDNLNRKYDLESQSLFEKIELTPEVHALYECGAISVEDILGKRQYVYPTNYLLCANVFIEKEIKL